MRWLAFVCLLALTACASKGGSKATSAGQPAPAPAVKQSSATTTAKSSASTTAKKTSAPKTAKKTSAPTTAKQASAPTTAEKSDHPKVQVGAASFYASKHHGLKTASGEIYDEAKLTAAHRTLPFGTIVKVTNLDNDRSAVFRINDRGPFIKGRVVDVSRRGAFELGFIQQGIANVRVEIIGS